MAFVNLVDIIYPVGSVYLTTGLTSPATLFGGSWSQKSGGCLKPSTSSLGSFSGNAKLLESNIPEHRHWIKPLNSAGDISHADTYLAHYNTNVGSGSGWGMATSSSSSSDGGFNYWWGATDRIGASQTDLNVYGLNVGVWVRTS